MAFDVAEKQFALNLIVAGQVGELDDQVTVVGIATHV
jgi:hypothetical protein